MDIIESRLLARPLYLQARDVIANKILSGAWKPGASLPNESQLAQQLGLSIGTVRKALNILEREHVITRRQGRGTFINDFSEQDRRLTTFADKSGSVVEGDKREKSISNITADASIAQRLQIEKGEEVVRIDRLLLNGSRPFSAETSYLPARRFPKRIDDISSGLLSLLAQRNGKIISYGEEYVSVAPAGQDDASDLDVAEGTPIAVLDRVVYSDRHEVLEWRLARCSLNKLRMVVRYE